MITARRVDAGNINLQFAYFLAGNYQSYCIAMAQKETTRAKITQL
jgi:hypothetical protein